MITMHHKIYSGVFWSPAFISLSNECMYISLLPQKKHFHPTFWGHPVHSGLAVPTGRQTILWSPYNLCPLLSHSTEAVHKEIQNFL